MKKQTRIGLMVLVTVVLLLVLAVPGLAKKGDFACTALVNTIDKQGNFHTTIILGELEAFWDDDILYNECTSTMEFGVQINPGIRFATFDEICDRWEAYCDSDAGTVILTTDANPETNVLVREPDTHRMYLATDWEYSIFDRKKNNISISMVYDPSE